MTSRIEDYIYFNKKIGKGSFSRVYKGYKVGLPDKLYAIKKMEYDPDNQRLKQEIEVMKNISHPNIIKLHEVIYEEDSMYLILEYCKNGDLSKYLKNRPLKEEYAQKYLRQLVSALKYLISQNIIHRDLKPHNILVNDNHDLKISDFGFARYFEKNTLVDTLCGSPLYMAPEIMKNQNYTIKSDLWSVGIILYEMLTGFPPFKVKSIYNLIKSIEHNKINLPKNISISDECNDLLFKLLVKEPEDRIDWEDFFNHPWLSMQFTTESMIVENKLLGFSISESLPRMSILEEKKNKNKIFLPDLSDDEEEEIIYRKRTISKPINIPKKKDIRNQNFNFESLYERDYIMVEPPSDEEEQLENSFIIGQLSGIFNSSINKLSRVLNYF
jgi:serine/threonine-protein kinase ULK2